MSAKDKTLVKRILSRVGLLVHFLSASTAAVAQSDTLRLEMPNREPLIGAVIQVFVNAGPEPKAFLVTDLMGLACCIDSGSIDSLLISHLEVGKVRKFPQDWQRQGNLLILQIPPGTMDLPMAIVSERFSGIIIKGDTVRFDASRFADGREFDLKELINQLPGLTVGPDGTVSYQGRGVDRVLLDGQDVVRSRFNMLNDLLVPEEVVSAEVIRDRPSGGDERTSLNINTRTKARLRADLGAGVSARGQPAGHGNLLRTNPGHLQSFLSASANYLGGSADRDGANLRETETDTDALRRVEQLSAIRPDEPQVISSIRGRDHVVQANLDRSDGAQRSAFYVSFRQNRSYGRSLETVLSASDGNELGRLDKRSENELSRLLLNVRHADVVGSRLSYAVFGQGLLANQDLIFRGSSSVAGVRSAYLFDNDAGTTWALVGARASYKLNPKVTLQSYSSQQWSSIDYQYSLIDTGTIYRVAAGAGMIEPDSLNLRPERQLMRQLYDLRIQHSTGNFKLVAGVQPTYDRLGEQFETSDENLTESGPKPTQTFGGNLLYAQVATSIQKVSIDLTGGARSWSYSRDSLNFQDWYPQIKTYMTYRFSPVTRLGLVAQAHTQPFAADMLWTTLTPISTREFREGYLAEQPLTSTLSVSADLRRITGSGNMLLVGVQTNRTDQSLTHITNINDGHIEYLPTLVGHQARHRASAHWSVSQGQHRISSHGTYQAERAELRTQRLQTFRSSEWTGRFSVATEWSKLLHLSHGISYQHTTQNTLEQSSSKAFRFSTWQPSTKLRLRGQALTWSLELSALLSAKAHPVPQLSSSFTYRKHGSPLLIVLSGQDLLNYRSSSFRTLQVSSADVRIIDFGRRQGYVELLIGWRFSRAN